MDKRLPLLIERKIDYSGVCAQFAVWLFGKTITCALVKVHICSCRYCKLFHSSVSLPVWKEQQCPHCCQFRFLTPIMLHAVLAHYCRHHLICSAAFAAFAFFAFSFSSAAFATCSSAFSCRASKYSSGISSTCSCSRVTS
jgi:hypothetical protein